MNKNTHKKQCKKKDISGWVLLDKPSGMGSTQCVNMVKNCLNVKKAGHAGTLDPIATGMLPIALGKATKVIPYIVDSHKSYEFVVQWGVETDSCDSQGQVVSVSQKKVKQQEIEDILANFIGDIVQVPPIFSAVKVDGVRAYVLAREGEVPELSERNVYVHSLEIVKHDEQINQTRFLMECGKGVYVRSVARDMGRIFTSGGHVIELRRRFVGVFQETDMILLDKIKNFVHTESIASAYEAIVKPIEVALVDVPAIELPQEILSQLILGREILINDHQLDNVESGSVLRVRQNVCTLMLVKYEKAHLKMVRRIENSNQSVFNVSHDLEVVS